LLTSPDLDFIGGFTLTVPLHQIFVKNPNCE